MLRYGYPLRSCLWVRSIIGCGGVGLAWYFVLVVFSLVRLVINEHLTSHKYHTHIPTGYEPLHVPRSTKTEIGKFEGRFATPRYLSIISSCSSGLIDQLVDFVHLLRFNFY